MHIGIDIRALLNVRAEENGHHYVQTRVRMKLGTYDVLQSNNDVRNGGEFCF